ncbi:MAG TPA: extracellular solute-binding protein [Gaiellaceae bacterium]|nr:extracellular solute-binding protein [Gaiellaceae bacterium]
MIRRGLVGVALLLTVAIATAAASARSGGPVTLNVYSGQHPDTVAALAKAFEAKSGIHVNVLSNTDSQLATLIVLQGSASPADVFVAENSPALEVMEQRGLLSKVASSTLAKIPSKYNSPNGYWLAMAAHASVLVYNTSALKPSQLPGSILALATPKWSRKLAVAPSETDFQPIVIAVARKVGDARAVEWLKGLRANAEGNVYSNNGDIVAQVNSGHAAIAVIDPYYWFQLKNFQGPHLTHSAIEQLAPGDPGYIVDVSGAAIVKSSKHQAQDQQFLAFMASKQGQEALTQGKSYEYPLIPGVSASKALYPWSKLQPDPITPAQLGDGSTALTLLQQSGLL